MNTSARNKMMDYLARREHSEQELRQKLSKEFSDEKIEQAIQFAIEKNWLPSNDSERQELSYKIAEKLSLKGKSTEFINQYLEQIGLPKIEQDESAEEKKALAILERKFQKKWALLKDQKDQIEDFPAEAERFMGQVFRFLVSSGFSESVSENVLKKL